VLVSGIGCSGRMSTYADFNTVHTTHGRALTFATGTKLAREDLTVIVIMGDGDATAIGGNHYIHAARRNIDMTAIIINNQIYGMTGGQNSPTTPYGANSTTTPYGMIEQSFDISGLAVAAGAPFVAKSTVYHASHLDGLIEKAIRKKGFSVVEAMSNCHIQYGRRNKMGSPVKMIEWFKDNTIRVEAAAKLSPEEVQGKIMIGVLADRDRRSYEEEYALVRTKAKAKMR
ncbi:MAG: thiamine pyrophosphate-dependent enzyme, partial [Syntrophales bacterium]|nr:thiamine pyrophosphate-dependent enzyme [Syntrophales bacterium]